MKKDEREQSFLVGVRRILDQQIADLDPCVRRRLAATRREAAARNRRFRPRLALRTALACGMLLLLLLAVSLPWMGRHDRLPDRGVEVADLDILTADEPLDFYANLEFYAWLSWGDDHVG